MIADAICVVAAMAWSAASDFAPLDLLMENNRRTFRRAAQMILSGGGLLPAVAAWLARGFSISL